MKRFAIAVVGALLVAPVGAQAQAVNTAAIQAACSGGATGCAAAIRVALANLPAAGAARQNAVLAIAQAVAAGNPSGAAPAVLSQVQAAIAAVAAAAPAGSPAQLYAVQVGSAVAAGESTATLVVQIPAPAQVPVEVFSPA